MCPVATDESKMRRQNKQGSNRGPHGACCSDDVLTKCLSLPHCETLFPGQKGRAVGTETCAKHNEGRARNMRANSCTSVAAPLLPKQPASLKKWRRQ